MHLEAMGNTVGVFPLFRLVTFPVKVHWKDTASLDLIRRSALDLMATLDMPPLWPTRKVILPRPGCGNGGLSWVHVRPVIAPILDNRVWVIARPMKGELARW